MASLFVVYSGFLEQDGKDTLLDMVNILSMEEEPTSKDKQKPGGDIWRGEEPIQEPPTADPPHRENPPGSFEALHTIFRPRPW